MSGLETATLVLGTAVAKAAFSIWFRDAKLVEALSHELVDEQAGVLRGLRDRRKFRRFRDQAAERVDDRIRRFVEHEFGRLEENDRLAAVVAVTETFDEAELTDADLFRADLDASSVYRRLLPVPEPARWGLGADGTAFYRLLLRECCGYLIEVARTLPGGGMTALEEVLRRETQILEDVRTALERLPARRGVEDFEADHRQQVAHRLDRIEFFGATLTDESRRYPLSVAYLSLTVSGQLLKHGHVFPDLFNSKGWTLHDQSVGPESTAPATARVEAALAASNRLFIRGQAGIGKTTLLHWIAVQSARNSFPESMAGWRDTVPFFVPLRRYAGRDLPAPDQFLAETGTHIAAEMPPGWVQQQLRSGRAIVLIDGVDEVAENRRAAARDWLSQLVAAFPLARYVVTSRPAAVSENWLARDDFDTAELEPMTPEDVKVFVHRWHEAMRDGCGSEDDRKTLTGYESELFTALAGRAHLRRLSGYPLLCALLCALHRDRRAQLPASRMELYDVALQMLLERRDTERHITGDITLARTQKTLLLQELAYWLIRNGWSDAGFEEAADRIARRLDGMPQVGATAPEVLRHLLERSGLLQEPVDGRVDFVHRTFQEYLAAQGAVAADDIGVLISHAHLDQWREVVVMAAGHASATQRERLVTGLLDRAGTSRSTAHDTLLLVTVACLETSPELPGALRARVGASAAELLPPRTMTTAQTLAKLGDTALDLLGSARPITAKEVAATIRAAGLTGDPAALDLIARYRDRPEKVVVSELIRAWNSFDPQTYARDVLSGCRPDGNPQVRLDLSNRSLVPGLQHLPALRHLKLQLFDTPCGDFGFVRDLAGLESLTVFGVDTNDLHALESASLRTLDLLWFGGTRNDIVDGETLVRLPRLETLYLRGRRVTNLGPLAVRDTLRGLALTWATGGDLEKLSTASSLRFLFLDTPQDLTSLEPLRFLNRPGLISLRGCPGIDDIADLRLWADSLTFIALDVKPGTSLAPLSELRRLSTLEIPDTMSYDLAPLEQIPKMHQLRFSRTQIPVDLRRLPRLPALRNLALRYPGDIDLTPLAGWPDLVVEVPRRAEVHGEEGLGPGSRIKRDR
ncbi:NACHT domain-containing protein [Longispora urticae]